MKVASVLTAVQSFVLILGISAYAGSDFDGDGTDDYGCYDAAGNYGQPPGSWYFMTSSNGFFEKTFGYSGTVPVVGDFDGDGTDDYGCYDAAGNYGQPPGSWYFMTGTDGFFEKTFGYADTVPVMGQVYSTAVQGSGFSMPETYEEQVSYFKARYDKSDTWATWMVTNNSRYDLTFDATKNKPDVITISFRYETPINYDPAWTSEAEHMAVFKAMAQGAYPGYNFDFVFNGDTSTSYANIIAGIAENLSYSDGKDVYLYYETIFNHEFGHTMKLLHHYDSMATMGDGQYMPPGDTECIMDRTSSLFCSACRTALGLPLDVSDAAAVDAAVDDILSRYP